MWIFRGPGEYKSRLYNVFLSPPRIILTKAAKLPSVHLSLKGIILAKSAKLPSVHLYLFPILFRSVRLDKEFLVLSNPATLGIAIFLTFTFEKKLMIFRLLSSI